MLEYIVAIGIFLLFCFLILCIIKITYRDLVRIKRREAAEILKIYSELKGELSLKEFLEDIETIKKELS